ncbi:unnamed protein product [Durusdinium trenchii]|uniref:Kinesin light chain n=1 Tax=Durusdinium trenchii TaxID=1381693 RepID=A0ABP0HME9_9DINO
MASDGVAHIPRFRPVEDERDLSMELMIDAGVPDEAHCSKDEDEVDADEAKAPPQEQNEESKDLELIVTFLEQMKPSTPELLRSSQKVFVDRACINQFDENMKTTGILNIGAMLKVTVYIYIYIYESKRSSWRIAFGNTSEPWTRAWSVCSTEKLKNAHCWCCSVNHIDPQRVLCDRLIVRKCVICWFGTEEHFNELVRSSVALQQLGSDAFPYFAMLGATTPILSAFMDSVASLLRVDNEETREVVFSIFIIRYLTYWLWGVPCQTIASQEPLSTRPEDQRYREGGIFKSAAYEDSDTISSFYAWKHLKTGIIVWKDAMDLSSLPNPKVYFHYTGELPFRNITALEKEAAEIWASLKTEGPSANAWWGAGIFCVPKPPNEWKDRHELLDNNFRNMMRRDHTEKGEAYVQKEYPPRAGFCIPLLVDAANAYDISERQTPEMKAAGKAPGRNLANKLLNEPGQPQRCCVVLRVEGESGIENAKARLVDTLRKREASAENAEVKMDAKERLGQALLCRGMYEEALSFLSEALSARELSKGKEHPDTLNCTLSFAECLELMGRFNDAEKLHRRCVEACERILGADDDLTWGARRCLAGCLWRMAHFQEAELLMQQALEALERKCGAEDPETLQWLSSLATLLAEMGRAPEAEALMSRLLERQEHILGTDHPDTLTTLHNLAGLLIGVDPFRAEPMVQRCLDCCRGALGESHPTTLSAENQLALCQVEMGHYQKAEAFNQACLAARERVLGANHPDTLISVNNLANCFSAMGDHLRAESLLRRAVESHEQTIGVDHPTTLVFVNNLARCLLSMGRHDEAEPLSRRAAHASEQTLGKEHPQAIAFRETWTDCLEAMGEIEGSGASSEAQVVPQENNFSWKEVEQLFLSTLGAESILSWESWMKILQSAGVESGEAKMLLEEQGQRKAPNISVRSFLNLVRPV